MTRHAFLTTKCFEPYIRFRKANSYPSQTTCTLKIRSMTARSISATTAFRSSPRPKISTGFPRYWGWADAC